MKETINQRVAQCRRLANLTQQKTAEKLGMKCSTYSQMERKGNISAQKILDLAAIFNISPNVLLYGEDKHPTETNTVPINRLGQAPTPPVVKPKYVPPILLTNREENIIKILRTISKDDRDEVIALIEKKYKGE